MELFVFRQQTLHSCECLARVLKLFVLTSVGGFWLLFNVPVNTFSVILVLSSTVESLKCLAQGYYTAAVGFEPWTSCSESDALPLSHRSLFFGWGRESLFGLLSFICNYVVSIRMGFLLVLGVGCIILMWHFLCLPYNYFESLTLTENLSSKASFKISRNNVECFYHL